MCKYGVCVHKTSHTPKRCYKKKHPKYIEEPDIVYRDREVFFFFVALSSYIFIGKTGHK